MNFGNNIQTIKRESQAFSDKVRQRNSISVKAQNVYTHKLSLYNETPNETISLLDFRDLGSMRLDLLRNLENLKEKYPTFKALKEFMKESTDIKALGPSGLKLFNLQTEEVCRQDRISHFILRLAFCQSPEQTKWFIQQELDLFKLRFEILNHDKLDFLRFNNFQLFIVSDQEKAELNSLLISSNIGITHANFYKKTFFKVYFTEAFDLVRHRKVYLNHGYLYISDDDLIAIVATKFRLNMATGMAREFKHLGFIQEEERLLPLLKALTHRGYTNKEYKAQNAKDITPDLVEGLANTSFPLCMRQIHSRLRADHHLRHFARRQYGLFLKGIGMSLESSLSFFRDEFTKKMDADKVMLLLHQYGKEGRHVESHPFDCAKIILTNPPAAQDCHGCPYRHSNPDALTQRLERLGIGREQSAQIIQLSKQNQYDKACTRFFELIHKMPEGGLGHVITHPNQYFDLSRQILEGTRSKDAGCSQQVTVTVPAKKPTNEDYDDFNNDMEF